MCKLPETGIKAPSARFRPNWGALFFLAFLGGCGPAVGSIAGKVTYEGQELPNGLVAFVTADGQVFNGGITNGSFAIKGIPVGPTKVIVQTAATSKTPPGKANKIKPTGAQVEAEIPPVYIPQKYRSAETSGLTHNVISGAQTMNLSLKD